MEKNKEYSFEEAVEGLEEIVAKLEEGDVPLEEAIDYYKKGVELSKLCHEKLQSAEKQLAVMMTEDGETPIDPEELSE
ncbi:exodeoxyribonuclease VII small subunit [Jeotgalibacillus haloalkalitolerans]|uniref:Exodeoxyribonuclease 7 small subunit n=1 Tax=Jeotgalibacillus haloalkalitolerans TaxID=3104292 RepID=A0ABU5KMC7_9BACL|nr:exodeoxyribonuclease VII small subunit [Jeotgalibacillus sp. HH7-29]MDZ5712121.1 exodeoxyribonuclease VII small subunit [Jeotgalibacillus sp. HH7-29]